MRGSGVRIKKGISPEKRIPSRRIEGLSESFISLKKSFNMRKKMVSSRKKVNSVV